MNPTSLKYIRIAIYISAVASFFYLCWWWGRPDDLAIVQYVKILWSKLLAVLVFILTIAWIIGEKSQNISNKKVQAKAVREANQLSYDAIQTLISCSSFARKNDLNLYNLVQIRKQP